MKRKVIMFWLLVAPSLMALAQSADEPDYAKQEAEIKLQWQHADFEKDGLPGTSSEKAYAELLSTKKSSTVIVAIIDSGSETFHSDLKNNIWTNEDEIAGNGMDDDKNGYIDDIHGWSFIGGPKGDVEFDNLEFTRIFIDLKKRFSDKAETSITSEEKKDFEKYQKMKLEYEKRLQTAKENEQLYTQVKETYDICNNLMKEHLNKTEYTIDEVKATDASTEQMAAAKEVLINLMESGFPADFKAWKEQVQNPLKYQLNLEYDSRKLVGDNYADSNEKYYGNNHVDGPHSDHGTHVGGIVGAQRNGFGIDGIAADVKLMIIRCVPDGDERDKDIANSIRYATDNGARVINMSFGKSYSPQKEVVDAAVKYAESKNVLLVHAAGNDNKNTDTGFNFPTSKYLDGTFCSTWLSVGASGLSKDALAASFSNYGRKSVDLFAPGVEVFSTVMGGKYEKNDGTSMASPVVAGVAAALLSYYPNLSAKDVKQILMQSAAKYGKQKVMMPGNAKKKVKFKKLSVTGGIVNLYNALKLAETWK